MDLSVRFSPFREVTPSWTKRETEASSLLMHLVMVILKALGLFTKGKAN